jgi:hypothetical protein
LATESWLRIGRFVNVKDFRIGMTISLCWR